MAIAEGTVGKFMIRCGKKSSDIQHSEHQKTDWWSFC